MRVNYGKVFNDVFIANLLLSATVKEFWRSVRIRRSYGKKSSGTFFSGHGVCSKTNLSNGDKSITVVDNGLDILLE